MFSRMTIILVRTNKLDQFIQEYMAGSYGSVERTEHRFQGIHIINTNFSIRVDSLDERFLDLLNNSKELVASGEGIGAYKLTQLERKTISKFLESEVGYIKDALSMSTFLPSVKVCLEERQKMCQEAKYVIDTWCLTDDNKEDDYWTIVAGVE